MAAHGPDDFSKVQLWSVIEEIAGEADRILRLCGIANLDAHFVEAWASLSVARDPVLGDGADTPYRPFTDVKGEQAAGHLDCGCPASPSA
jgi:hypothetical protein